MGHHSDPQILKKDQFQEQSLSKESVFCCHLTKFILDYSDLRIWNAEFNDLCQSKCFRKIRFVQFSIIWKQVMIERQSGDWLHQKEAEHTKWKELVPGQSSHKPQKLEVSPVLQVRTRGQSKITNTKCFWSKSEGCHDQWCPRQCLNIVVSMELESESEAVRSLKTWRRTVSALCFGRQANWITSLPGTCMLAHLAF